jgi:hypothetical protein
MRSSARIACTPGSPFSARNARGRASTPARIATPSTHGCAPGILDRFAFGAALFTTSSVAFRLIHPLALACLLGLAVGCGQNAEEKYAGLSTLVVGQPDGIGYRLRYLNPPWENVDDDPLVRGASGATLQFGLRDGVGAVALPDLTPSPQSSRVLEIERSAQTTIPIDGIITYPKYRLEVSVLHCDELQIQVAQQDSCAKQLNVSDVNGRTGVELNSFFGQNGRPGKNELGQPYYEFMTRVRETSRYRRVVYYETSDRLTAIRLGFEANPALSELEVTQMIKAFEVLDNEFDELDDSDASASALDAGTTP